MTLLKQILQFKKKKMQFFTTPSHSQGKFYLKCLKDLYSMDFSEMDGLDNLRNPENILLKMLNNFTKIYDTKKTFALINGSSSGNIATMLSVLNSGDKVLIADNCHVSVLNGVELTKACAVWVSAIKKDNCVVDIDRDFIFEELKKGDYKFLVLTSPTYEGVDLKIKEIIDFAHQNNVLVLVDEAHGALFPFSEKLPQSAIELNADFIVQSLHKTAGGVNPSALLHLGKNTKFEPEKIQKALNLINTTSPSYPLLLSMEYCVNYLNENKKIVDELVKNISDFKKYFEEKIEFLPSYQILMNIKNKDMIEFTDLLYEKYNIECEIAEKEYALFYCGLGTDKKKLNYLQKVIEKEL